MMNFDSPNREQCAVFENRTNSPLQALDLMNDVTFLEASRKFAERMMNEGGATPRSAHRLRLQAAAGARAIATDKSRSCWRPKLAWRRTFTATQRQRSSLCNKANRRSGVADSAELAAWTAVASLMLNMDEAITKQ